jgi:hypothetical protein
VQALVHFEVGFAITGVWVRVSARARKRIRTRIVIFLPNVDFVAI